MPGKLHLQNTCVVVWENQWSGSGWLEQQKSVNRIYQAALNFFLLSYWILIFFKNFGESGKPIWDGKREGERKDVNLESR